MTISQPRSSPSRSEASPPSTSNANPARGVSPPKISLPALSVQLTTSWTNQPRERTGASHAKQANSQLQGLRARKLVKRDQLAKCRTTNSCSQSAKTESDSRTSDGNNPRSATVSFLAPSLSPTRSPLPAEAATRVSLGMQRETASTVQRAPFRTWTTTCSRRERPSPVVPNVQLATSLPKLYLSATSKPFPTASNPSVQWQTRQATPRSAMDTRAGL